MKTIRNHRGVLQAGVGLILKIVLFLVITGSSLYIFSNVALVDVKAQSAARNLGVIFDVLALTTKDVKIEANCQQDVIFTIDGSRITAKIYSMTGEGFGEYYYLHEKGASLPGKKTIDCSGRQTIEVSKTLDKTTLNPIISLK